VLEALADVAIDLPRQRQQCPCDACEETGRTPDGALCTARPEAAVGDHEWDRCPYGLLASGWWQMLTATDASAMVSPIGGWPDTYSAGAVWGMLALRSARQRAEARALKRARQRAGM